MPNLFEVFQPCPALFSVSSRAVKKIKVPLLSF
jgi:hypothetical protein